jgi:murein DD-endopeptidase MepM/ murein hydrolase activator NlpD
MMSKNAINRYKLPVPKNQLQRIDRSSSPAHQGNLRNAIDFIADEETPVLAAADGIVTFVKDDSNTGGSNPIYWNHIEHHCGKHFQNQDDPCASSAF